MEGLVLTADTKARLDLVKEETTIAFGPDYQLHHQEWGDDVVGTSQDMHLLSGTASREHVVGLNDQGLVLSDGSQLLFDVFKLETSTHEITAAGERTTRQEFDLLHYEESRETAFTVGN